VPGAPPEAFGAVLAALAAPVPVAGDPIALPALGVEGRAERVAPTAATLLVERPAPGIVFVAAEGSASPAFVSLYGYFFGPESGAVAEQAAARWTAWLAQTFPPSG
jgi:hypothetical protein